MEMPQDVGRVNLGAMLVGEGTLWVDDIKLELLGSSIAPAAKAPSQADTRQMVLEAKASADAWLALIDSSKYQESWEKAASFLKNAVSSEKWAAEIPTVRNPLGKIVMRNLKQAQYMNAIPGAPDGKYVLVKYETDFESKSGAEESITMMFCPDGEWRAAGYFIR